MIRDRALRAARRIGPRTEAVILLPAALFLVVLVSLFILFAYRSAIEQLLMTRGEEASRLARQVAGALPAGSTPRPEALRRLAPQAWAIAVVDDDGRPLSVSGDLAPRAAPAGGTGSWRSWLWPAPSDADVVSGFAARSGGRGQVRLDLPARVLRGKARSLRLLTPLVLLIDAAVIALLLLYLRRLLAPIDRLIERARRVGDSDHDGDELAAVVAAFDKALEALASTPADDELAAFQQAMVRGMESGVLLCDAEGGVLALNELGARLLGVVPPAAGTTALGALLEPHPALSALLERAVHRQATVQRQECAIDTGGGQRTLGLTVHPLRREDGAVRGFLALFADLTAARRHAERRRLADSLSQLGELAAGVAHEMRNSLATLRGYLGLIDRDREGTAAASYLDEMRAESEHLERVLDDFLSFARPGKVQPREIDLRALLARCAADPALDGAAVELVPDSEPGGAPPARLQGDPQLLAQALRNLLRNAVQAQRASGSEAPIAVRLRARGGHLEIAIEDRGPGLPAAVAERLFQPFVTERAGGVGLGLAISRRLLLLHGGTLALENREGGGARARIRLPCDQFVTEGNASPYPADSDEAWP